MTIRLLLQVVGAIVMGVVCVMGATFYYVGHQARIAAGGNARVIKAQHEIGIIGDTLPAVRASAADMTQNQALYGKKDVEALFSSASAAVQTLQQTLPEGSRQRELLHELAPVLRAMQHELLPRLANEPESPDAAAALRDALGHAGRLVRGMEREAMNEVEALEEHLFGILDMGEKTSGVLVLVSFLLLTPLMLLVIRRVTGSMLALSENMEALAAGQLSVEVFGLERQDEIGRMAHTVQIFKENALQKLALEKKQAEQKIKAEADKKQMLHRLAESFRTRVETVIQSVSAAATQLQQTAEVMVRAVQKSSDKSGNVALLSSETSQNVQMVASASEELSSSIREISQQLANASRVVNDAVQSVEAADRSTGALAQASEKIGSIVEMIRAIAHQINMLALNATIEAARAGEAGRGFSVVASEVKNLAGQTTKATEEVSRQIEQVQEVSAEVVKALGGIKATIGKVEEYTAGIASAVEEQSAVTNDIVANMSAASRGTQGINTNIGEVSQCINDARGASEQVLAAAGDLSRQAEGLHGDVEGFLREVESA